MHITRITSNIKGGVDQELGEKTLIVGPNGIGKSAIINAVELAVGGSASDIVGRAEVKREAELLTLAGGSSVTADAEFSNGSRASYKATSNGRGGAKKATHSCPVTAAFPVRDVRAALGGSSDTARSWLLSKVVKDVTREDVLSWFTPEAQELYNHYGKAEHKSEIDILLSVRQNGSKKIRADKKTLTTEQVVLDRLASNLDAEPTELVLTRAREAEAKALSDYEVALKASSKPGVEAQVEHLKSVAMACIEEMDSAQKDAKEIGMITPPGEEPTNQEVELIDRIQALAGIHQMHMDLGVDEACLICERSGPLDHRALREAKLAVGGNIASRREWWEAATLVQKTAETSAKEAELAVRAYQDLASDLSKMDDSDLSIEEAKNVWERAQIKKTALEGAASQWKNLGSQKDAMRTLKADISDLGAMVEQATAAVNELVKSAVERFEASVQSYLPESDLFKLVLEEDGKEVCRFGFDRGINQLHTALSGAEWARLTLALASASATGEEDILILTPEERAFDPVTLRNVMAALSEAPGQVLITSPIKHKGRLPKGWTVIEVGVDSVSDSTQNHPQASINA
jgi:hypothetical protein